MKLNIDKIKISTKAIVTAIATGTSLLQVQEFRDFAIKLAIKHPHIGSILVGLTTIAVALHNPQVQKFLHISSTENVPLPGGQVATVTTDTTAKVE